MNDLDFDQLRRYYRMDGSAYPPGDEGLMEWALDFEDWRGRIVQQDHLWNGIFLSTVWLGLPAFSLSPRPLIFETMAFDNVMDCEIDIVERYATLYEAEVGHLQFKRQLASIKFTLLLFLRFWLQASGMEEEP